MKILVLIVLLFSAANAPSIPASGTSPRSAVVGSLWRWPLAGPGAAAPRVVRPFSPPALRWLRGHRGVDLAAAGAQRVLAAGPGTVVFAGTLSGRGVVVVSHGALRTSYEPVTPSVHVGDVVSAGSALGTLAAGHCAASACLHWGLLTGHGHAVRYYDPLLLVGLVRLRLEPVRVPAGPSPG
ncbi:peptidoglycan DD-metalloendopeptidase family protein [Actinocrinis puniceicyclus]|uniref:Peptidoglycan DD-metalloendopeptidase family protein n=1 Tax=Actinocrinis puniceicyclus TaxID=977794 RepID=A0A8J7WMF0_9ACTN|nr:M23 family metallopeptidase [Actinocrinis puniceicyclus]MBS2962832.1 peptidoglycan DD-metalloendopeptidase family protein [Actinocrinis puniceicyclus]